MFSYHKSLLGISLVHGLNCMYFENYHCSHILQSAKHDIKINYKIFSINLQKLSLMLMLEQHDPKITLAIVNNTEIIPKMTRICKFKHNANLYELDLKRS